MTTRSNPTRGLMRHNVEIRIHVEKYFYVQHPTLKLLSVTLFTVVSSSYSTKLISSSLQNNPPCVGIGHQCYCLRYCLAVQNILELLLLRCCPHHSRVLAILPLSSERISPLLPPEISILPHHMSETQCGVVIYLHQIYDILPSSLS